MVLLQARVIVDETMVRNAEYSILLVMSELSTVQCDRALGLWIAVIRASSVDGELPWRSSGWAAVVASIPPLIEDMYRAAADPTGLTGLAAAARYLSPPHLFVGVESLESFSVYSFSFLVL